MKNKADKKLENVSSAVPAFFAKIDYKMAIKLRAKLNCNQTEFWGMVGITQSGGCRYEAGRNLPLPLRIAMAFVFKDEIEEILSKKSAKSKKDQE